MSDHEGFYIVKVLQIAPNESNLKMGEMIYVSANRLAKFIPTKISSGDIFKIGGATPEPIMKPKVSIDRSYKVWNSDIAIVKIKAKDEVPLHEFASYISSLIHNVISEDKNSGGKRWNLKSTQDFFQLKNIMQSLCNKPNYQIQCIFACSSKEILGMFK